MLFGGVRPGSAARVGARRAAGDGDADWLPVATIGDNCDEQTGTFLTGSDGFFRRTAAWEGPADYRLVWERETEPEYGPPIRVTKKSLIET